MGPATSEQEQGQGQGHGQKQEQQRGLHQDQDHEHGQEGKPNKRQTSVSFASTPPSVSSGDSGGGEWRKARGSAASARQWRQQLEDEAGQLTVCDITGDWGLYQWSLCLFAIIFSAVSALPVVFGPILTPDMPFRCNETNSNFDHQTGQPLGNATGGAADQNECFKSTTLPDGRLLSEPCRSFLYDDTKLGLTLTNRFDLVCERQWLRSLVSSVALAGMLVSSVTLGLVSDKFGRLRCIRLAFVIAALANAFAIVTSNYFLFCACIFLMSYALVGAANALSTLLMEATSPRFRPVSVVEYGIGWGLGVILVPLINELTLDYRCYMGVLLAWLLSMTPWLHFGVFESIRWLSSEGHLYRAQSELSRVCRFNRVRREGTKLAQEIARIQAQQVRSALRLIEAESAPRQLARLTGLPVGEMARELDLLTAAVRRSFFGSEVDGEEWGGSENGVPIICINGAALSPTLSRLSFTVSPTDELVSADQAGPVVAVVSKVQDDLSESSKAGKPKRRPKGRSLTPRLSQLEAVLGPGASRRSDSVRQQGLIQMALNYSRLLQQADSGKFFLIQMFHPALWRSTMLLTLISIMYETTYFGLIQANKFVGSDITRNFVIGGLCEWAGCLVSVPMLIFLSRKLSLISTSLLGGLVCFGLALTYHMIPELHQAPHQLLMGQQLEPGGGASLPVAALASVAGLKISDDTTAQPPMLALNGTEVPIKASELDNLINNDDHLESISTLDLLMEQMMEQQRANESAANAEQEALLELRDSINFYLISAGKFIIFCGCFVSMTIAMEVFPNNLRQSGLGMIVFMGRVGSIISPFLFNDERPDRLVLKLTLVVLGTIGLLACLLVPFCIKESRDMELRDQMSDVVREVAEDEGGAPGQRDKRESRA